MTRTEVAAHNREIAIDRRIATHRRGKHLAAERKVERLKTRLAKVQSDAERAVAAIREELREAEREEMRAYERFHLAQQFMRERHGMDEEVC